jgi:RNA 3'-terminal phosphate cyclase
VLPLSLAKGKSMYGIEKVTEHLKINLQIVSQLTGCQYQIVPAENSYIVNIEGLPHLM